MTFAVVPNSSRPSFLPIMRIVVGLAFLEHGAEKLFGIPSGRPLIDRLPAALAWGAGQMEVAGGTPIVLGSFTRPVVFILSGFVAAAFFMAHAPQGFFPAKNFGEPALLYWLTFLYLAAAGPGPISIDRQQRSDGRTIRSSSIRNSSMSASRCEVARHDGRGGEEGR
jgi:putative oxidoreductase